MMDMEIESKDSKVEYLRRMAGCIVRVQSEGVSSTRVAWLGELFACKVRVSLP